MGILHGDLLVYWSLPTVVVFLFCGSCNIHPPQGRITSMVKMWTSLKAHVNSSCVLFLMPDFGQKNLIIMLTVLVAMLNIILFIVDLCRLCQTCVFSVIYAVFTHTIHVWYIYLHLYTIQNQPNVGEYAIHGFYGLCHVYPDFLALFFKSTSGSCRNIKCDLGVLWPMQHENDLEICVRKRCLEKINKSTHIPQLVVKNADLLL